MISDPKSLFSAVVQAFTFRPADVLLDEFRPHEDDDSMDKVLMRLNVLLDEDHGKFTSICTFLHVVFECSRLAAHHECGAWADVHELMATLFRHGSATQHAHYYASLRSAPDLHDHPSVFNARSALLGLLGGRPAESFPSLDTVLSSVDEDAQLWLKRHVLPVYAVLKSFAEAVQCKREIEVGDALLFSRGFHALKADLQFMVSRYIPETARLCKSESVVGADRIIKGYLNPPWNAQRHPTIKYVYEYLRVDRPHQAHGWTDDELACTGSLELSCFHARLMNRVMGKLHGLGPLLSGTFPACLPDRLPKVHFDFTVRLDGQAQHPLEAMHSKDLLMFHLHVNECLRIANAHNLASIDAVWMFRNKPDPVDSGFGGLMYALGLLGALKELPMIAILDLLKSGNKLVQAGLLLGLGCTFKGCVQEPLEGVLALHVRSHYSNVAKVTPSLDSQMAAIIAFSLMYYASGDRQVLKMLFAELVRTSSVHEKTSLPYPLSFYQCCAVAIGMVASGDVRRVLTSSQLDLLLSMANGHYLPALPGSVYAESSALLALMISAAGTGDMALSRCLQSVSRTNHRPLHWFYRRLAVLLIEWRPAVDIADGCDGDEYELFALAAGVYYSSLRQVLDIEQARRLFDSLGAAGGTAVSFCRDTILMAMAIQTNGQCSGPVVRCLRQYFGQPLDFDYGRSALHALAVGLACMPNRRLDLANHFHFTCLLVATLPMWSSDFADQSMYWSPLRSFWVMASVHHVERTVVEVQMQDKDLLRAFVEHRSIHMGIQDLPEPRLLQLYC